MLTLTRKTDYALVALAELASAEGVRGGESGRSGVSARELAERSDAPPAVLRNLLKSLASAGILESERGSRGGYRLARSAGSVSVAEVVEAVEGPVRLASCCGGAGDGVEGCGIEDRCRVRSAVRLLNARVHEMLRATSIADLLAGRAAGSESAGLVGIELGVVRGGGPAGAAGAVGAGVCGCGGPGGGPGVGGEVSGT